jgi:hypothetical protein
VFGAGGNCVIPASQAIRAPSPGPGAHDEEESDAEDVMDPEADELLVRVGFVEFVYIGVVAACAVARKRAKINLSCGRPKRLELAQNEGKDPRSNANIITMSVLHSEMHREQQNSRNEVGAVQLFFRAWWGPE